MRNISNQRALQALGGDDANATRNFEKVIEYDPRNVGIAHKAGATIDTSVPLFAMFSNESGLALPWERIVTKAEALEMGSRYFEEKQVVPTKIIST